MTKNAERREKFRKIQHATVKANRVGDPDIPDYWTGRESSFEMKRCDAQNRDATDLLNKDSRDRTEVPLGPRFNTPQWERTIRDK
jgi:hypothetical protein